MHDGAVVRKKYELLRRTLDERGRRLWAGAEADALGHGGVAAVARATGLAISTVRKGRDEVRAGATSSDVVRVRRPGAGRPRLEDTQPELMQRLRALVEGGSRGDPESPLRWTLKSTRVLADHLKKEGLTVSPQKVGELLRADGFSLQGTSRVKEGEDHPDRDAQFEHINARTQEFISRGVPVVSVDSKKKELVGEYANAGREWQPKGKPIEVLTYDFPDPDMRKAVPYGIYDVADNSAYVNVGTSHDTPTFATHSLETWWTSMGSHRYPEATELFLTADGGGSNSSRSHVWKAKLQDIADRRKLTIHVSHFPPGTSKWNKIEHRLFSFITLNWRGRPLRTYETVVSLIASTTTAQGLRVRAGLDEGRYDVGESVTKEQMKKLAIAPAGFHGDWNYTIRPRAPEPLDDSQHSQDNHSPTVKTSSRRRTKTEWQDLVHEQVASGMTAKQFCEEQGLSYPTFVAKRPLFSAVVRNRKARWQMLVDAQLASGLSAPKFCRHRNVNYDAFMYWQRRLKGSIRERDIAAWHQHVADYWASGETPKAFCRERQLKYHAFMRWRRQLERPRTERHSEA